MSTTYKALDTVSLDQDTALDRPRQELPTSVTLESPAMHVVTDLSKVAAMTINPNSSIDDANDRMIASSVRLLFVTDRQFKVMGLITSRDLMGDRAVLYMQEHGGRRQDILVRDIMTPRHRIEVLKKSDLEHARVGDVVETLRRHGRQHALVVDSIGDHPLITGVISTTQVGKQIGEEISVAGVASSFADMAARR